VRRIGHGPNERVDDAAAEDVALGAAREEGGLLTAQAAGRPVAAGRDDGRRAGRPGALLAPRPRARGRGPARRGRRGAALTPPYGAAREWAETELAADGVRTATRRAASAIQVVSAVPAAFPTGRSLFSERPSSEPTSCEE